MLRRWLAFSVVTIGLVPAIAGADPFDNYTNKILAKVPEAKGVEKITKLTKKAMVEHCRVLPGITAAFIVVKTNDNRNAKLLVRAGAQKIADKEAPPIVIIDRFVTFREGDERTIFSSGQNLWLFGDFRFNLDVGQGVPSDVAADLRVGVDKDGGAYLETIGKAEMFLVTKHLPEANPAKPEKLVLGAKFETRYFNGVYKLYDDGRRSGELHLKVADNGVVTGHYYSDKDKQKYEVEGEIKSNPKHQIDFVISFPQTSQNFSGFLFTGDGRVIAGTSVLQGRPTGFYAERIEEKKK